MNTEFVTRTIHKAKHEPFKFWPIAFGVFSVSGTSLFAVLHWCWVMGSLPSTVLEMKNDEKDTQTQLGNAINSINVVQQDLAQVKAVQGTELRKLDHIETFLQVKDGMQMQTKISTNDIEEAMFQ